ncbi:MAG TPA: MmgE/PrpD family protein [Candidatus Tectomicrobia bacterium]|nr:MmgE/PrpD family protein [Candidatus Tectomicrobia bacterium]
MTVARSLAEFLTQVAYVDLPEQTVDHAAMLIASTIASAALGSGITSSTIIRALARERGGVPDASVWFDPGPKLPVPDAAQVNAVMSDAAASDDSDLRNIVHAGTTLVATSLAMAERTGASGRDVLAAIVLGYEAAGRIGEAITPGFRHKGFHGCLVAIFGGAVASGRLLGLDAAHMAQAIALSATSMGGLAAAANTSVAREYHAGLAAMLGVHAALAAQKGFVAEESILETRHGFFEVYGGTDGKGVTQDLGEEWDIITDMAIKLVPGGHPSHALAEAAANAARAGDISPDEVETITLSRPGVTTLSGPLHPADLIDMAHSPAYFLAAGVADKDFSWVHATEAKITDPVIHQLLDKVRVGAPPTEHVERYKQGATVTIRTKDGRTFSNTVYAPRGAGIHGIGWADVDAKYRTLVPRAALSDRQVEASLQVIHDFRQVTHVSALTDLLQARV